MAPVRAIVTTILTSVSLGILALHVALCFRFPSPIFAVTLLLNPSLWLFCGLLGIGCAMIFNLRDKKRKLDPVFCVSCKKSHGNSNDFSDLQRPLMCKADSVHASCCTHGRQVFRSTVRGVYWNDGHQQRIYRMPLKSSRIYERREITENLDYEIKATKDQDKCANSHSPSHSEFWGAESPQLTSKSSSPKTESTFLLDTEPRNRSYRAGVEYSRHYTNNPDKIVAKRIPTSEESQEASISYVPFVPESKFLSLRQNCNCSCYRIIVKEQLAHRATYGHSKRSLQCTCSYLWDRTVEKPIMPCSSTYSSVTPIHLFQSKGDNKKPVQIWALSERNPKRFKSTKERKSISQNGNVETGYHESQRGLVKCEVAKGSSEIQQKNKSTKKDIWIFSNKKGKDSFEAKKEEETDLLAPLAEKGVSNLSSCQLSESREMLLAEEDESET